MIKNSARFYKILVIGVILLFIGVTITPSINAITDKTSTNPNNIPLIGKTVEFTVFRYKADGSVDKTKVRLSKEKALEFNERYKSIDDSEKSFLLLKEYGLIPEEVKREQLQQEMLDLADELDIIDEKINSIYERFANNGDGLRLFGINFLNEVNGASIASLNLPLGLSLITGILNWGDIIIPSFDLLYIAIYALGLYCFYNGVLPDFYSAMNLGSICLLGFIGYVMSTPFLGILSVLWGYTVASYASFVLMGLPSGVDRI